MKPIRILCAAAALLGAADAAQAAPRPHNVIIFVADGLRSNVVTGATAPELEAARREGVDFRNSHSLYPTFTTVNASAIATGHRIGDTGDFGNSIWIGNLPLPAPVNSSIADLEDNVVLGLMNQRFGGNYLGEASLIEAARKAGYPTAVLGKLGPSSIQDVTARAGETLVIDDGTGHGEQSLPLPPDVLAAIKAAGLEPVAPPRPKPNGRFTDQANIVQQQWLTDIAAKVVLPRLSKGGKPFVMLFWSRDPDATQHEQCDSPCAIRPGINGPSSMAAIRNASDTLGRLRQALREQGLEGTTDIFLTADHGFSTITKASAHGQLGARFLAGDIALALGRPLYDGALRPVAADSGKGVYIGPDPRQPQVVVAANGGSDLIYLPRRDPALARRIVGMLTTRDYVSALFVDDAYGRLPGALPLSAVGLKGSARTPTPAIVVGFRNTGSGCRPLDTCQVEVADNGRVEGQGMHGTFGRGDTHNFMAAIGPDFRRGFVDPAPVSNADITPTLARILGLKIPARGKLVGRPLSEALRGGKPVKVTRATVRSAKAANGFVTVLNRQSVGATPYYDAAGRPGTALGLEP